MQLRSLALTVLLLATLTPAVGGQLAVSSSVGGQSNTCYSAPIAAVLGLVASGAFQWCIQAPTEFSRVGDVFQVSSFFSGPALVGSAIVFAFSTSSGCTVGTITQGANLIGGLGLAWARAPITTNDRTCSVVFQWSTTIGMATSIVYLGFTATTKEETIESWPTSNVDILDDTTDDGSLTVDIADDATDDDLLTVPVASFNATVNSTFGNLTFPASLDVNARFPREPIVAGDSDWLHILAWIAAVLFFSYLGWLFALAFAVPGLLASLSPSINTMLAGLGLDFEALTILCLLGFILELAANRFSWGGYTSGSRRLTFTRKTGA